MGLLGHMALLCEPELSLWKTELKLQRGAPGIGWLRVFKKYNIGIVICRVPLILAGGDAGKGKVKTNDF